MFAHRVTLFRLLGFKISVDASWVFLAVLVTWSLAEGYFPVRQAGLSSNTYWAMGAAGALGLFVSIVFHELAHSLVARIYGLPISGITLFIFGGVAEMQDEPPSPRAEFMMAIAGPVASFVLAGLSHILSSVVGLANGLLPLRAVLDYLALINALLALFNLVPAFPLDGGRAFRAILWHWSGDLVAATRRAASVGGFFGLLLLALGLASIVTGDFVGGMWWALIGLFLRSAAAASNYQVMMKQVFSGESVARFMTPHVVYVPPELTLQSLVEDYVFRYHHDLFPVVDGGRLLGAVELRRVRTVPQEEWPQRSVGQVMTPLSEEMTITAGTDALAALSKMRETGNSRLMVTDGERLVGMVALKDMLEFLDLKMGLRHLG